ncbi:hypothetical protein [Magnetospirillum sp. SS-4]|uniref:hypothetical protein n=1 Tax=Magnetospirillum sp. SS-4 TaxID=2681465 RepID=UPI001573A072|nr:hypothetical protein [Magnetospirillum sp. SS-4]
MVVAMAVMQPSSLFLLREGRTDANVMTEQQVVGCPMTLTEIDLHNRVEHLETALLKLCAATMTLIALPQTTGEADAAGQRETAVKKAVDYVVQAAEIVSGEHAPRE